jgi:tetratricopeptide (TPR) repeat protein
VLRLDERPIVAMFTSSDDEMAVYRDWRDGAFPDSLAWIPASVELARRMPDVQWVIRMHPNLSGLGVNQEAVEQAQALAKALPENVRIVMPKDDVSSYTIADIAAIGVVYMTTMGLEMAARGQRVVAVARGWYGNSGIVEYVTRPEDYETAVRAALRAPRSMRRAQQTYRLLYRLNLQWSLPFPLVRYKGVDGVRAWKDVSELDPGKDPVLDRICATILEGTPTTDPPGPADLARSDAAEVASLLCVDPWLAEAEDQPERREADLLVAEGEAAYADGDLARARRSLLRATECEPDHPTAWMDLGAVLHAQGEGVAAVRALARAVNLNPLWSDAWTNLIAALMEQGSVADARRVLDAACAVLPDDPGLRALRASLV